MSDQPEVQENDTEATTETLRLEAWDELENVEVASEEAPAEEAPAEEVKEASEEKAEESAEESIQAPDAPTEWNQQLKEAFESIPTPEAKQAFIDAHSNMYRDYQKDKQAIAPIKATAESLRTHLDPIANDLKMMGVNEDQYIGQVFATAQALRTDPEGTLRMLAKDMGVEMGQQPDDTWVSPEQEQITKLEQQIKQMEMAKQQEQFQSQEQILEQQKLQANHAEAQFRSAKNADGTVKHPHIDNPEVKGYMEILSTKALQELQQSGEYLTPEQVTEKQESIYQQAVRLAGKDVTPNKAPVEKPQRIKATAPVETTPDLSTEQIAFKEYERMLNMG